MQKEPEFLAALAIVFTMANGHILDQLDVNDDPELASEFKEQCAALALIHNVVVNHSLAN